MLQRYYDDIYFATLQRQTDEQDEIETIANTGSLPRSRLNFAQAASHGHAASQPQLESGAV